jgi:ornithine cyclodeaminase/alanine dehydrogenase
MTLILSLDDVKSVLTMRDCIDAVEEAFRQLSLGNVVQPTRPTIRVAAHRALINAMPAYIGGVEALGVKWVGGYLGNPAIGLPVVQALIILNDGTNMTPLSVMNGTYITAVRTGAVSGVATRLLARPDASTTGIIGAGVQAKTQLEAVCAVRPIREARVYDVVPAAAAAYASEMSERLGVAVRPAASAEEAVRDMDVICAASTSKTPVVLGDWLREGAHINGVGSHSVDARELDTQAVLRSKVVVDTLDAAMAEAGDLLIPIEEGAITRDHIHAELGDVITGKKPGRTSEQEITLFKSQGLAIQDVATAQLVYRMAKERGIGTEVNL